MRNIFTILLLVLVPSALAFQTTDNTLRVGKKSDLTSERKIILTNDKLIRVPASNGDLEFSNDGGVSYKKIGAGGSSGGKNLINDNNYDFESGNPPAQWTASGGTFVAKTSAPINGLQSGQFDASSSAQRLLSTPKSVDAGFLSTNLCQADFRYQYTSGSSGDYKLVVRWYDDSTATTSTLAQAPLDVTTGVASMLAQIQFTCPDDALDTLAIGVESVVSNPGAIIVDDAFIGYGKNLTTVSQATLYMSVSWASFTAGNLWNTVPSTGTVNTGLSSRYNDTTKEITLANPGTYHVYTKFCTATAYSGAGDTSVSVSLNAAGASSGVGNITYGTTSGSGCRASETTVNVAAGSTTTVRPNTYVQTGTIANVTLSTDIYYYPTSPSYANTFETSGWIVDGNIYAPSNANVALGLVDSSTYTAASLSTLIMELRPGSLPAQIPCTSTNPSTGLTCAAGDEQIGFAFDLPKAGRVKVCMEFGHNMQVAANTNIDVVFQLVETSNTAQTIVQEGGSRVASYKLNSTSVVTNEHQPINICGTFNFSTAGKKTIRLMNIVEVGGSPTSNFLITDRYSVIGGNRDVHFYAYPIGEAMNSPVFTDLTNSLRNRIANSDAGQTATYAATITNNGSSCLLSNLYGGTWLTAARNGTGDCTLTYAGGYFNGVDVPVCIAVSSGETTLSAISASTSRWVTRNSSGTAIDGGMYIHCMGRK